MQSIQQLIDSALIRPPRERSGKWNPSSFGGCFRKQFWNRKDEPKSNPPDERTIRVFKMGELVEKFVVGLVIQCPECKGNPAFEYMGQNCKTGDSEMRICDICDGDGQNKMFETQVLCESEDVKGYADFVSENEVTDIKSQHSKSFWYMAKFKNNDIKQEKHSNWLQVGYYARELKKQFMRLVFVSKDDLCIQEYVQPLDEYWQTEIATELINLRGIWATGELPPALPRCKPNKKGEYWECEYCSWQKLCNCIEGYSDKDMYPPEIIKRADEILEKKGSEE